MKIKSKIHEYELCYYPDFSSCLAKVSENENICFLIDDQVHKIYEPVLTPYLKDSQLLKIEALESNKSFEKVGEYIVELLNLKCKKSTTLIVIGGGVLQDIGGFIASILFRGINWKLIPTTVLAQCDSCIGSKTSINIGNFKNQLGTFYPPNEILVTTQVLSTLKESDIKSGICEAIKLAMIEGPEAVHEMNSNLKKKDLLPIAEQSLNIKKKYIEEDENDKGIRNILNYGHTFGHSFESASNYQIPHGIAVGLGIIAANFFSFKLGMITQKQYQQSVEDISPWCSDYYSELHKISVDQMMNSMKTDKKNTTTQIGFILTSGYGKMQRCYLDLEKSKELLAVFMSHQKLTYLS